MALGSLGIARLASFIMADPLAYSRLKPVLIDYQVHEPLPIIALTLPGHQNLPRVQALLDFLV